jgi:hypothetical protein
MCDMLSQAAIWLRRRRGPWAALDFMKQQIEEDQKRGRPEWYWVTHDPWFEPEKYRNWH